jgi:hypothetical protein
MLRSPLVDFRPQFFSLFVFLSCDKLHVQLPPYFGNDSILHYVAIASPQRVDVAERLLKQGALVRERGPPEYHHV